MEGMKHMYDYDMDEFFITDNDLIGKEKKSREAEYYVFEDFEQIESKEEVQAAPIEATEDKVLIASSPVENKGEMSTALEPVKTSTSTDNTAKITEFLDNIAKMGSFMEITKVNNENGENRERHYSLVFVKLDNYI